MAIQIKGEKLYAPPSIDGSVTAARATATGLSRPATVTGAGIAQPLGPPGPWTLQFEDHFNGTSLNTTSVWEPFWYNDGLTLNNTPVHASNVSVSGGNLVLTMPNSTSGACVTTRPAGTRAGFKLGAPCVWEARCKFPGDGTSLYNWSAFWVLNDASGQTNVEVDIAEVWEGVMQENYHAGTSNPSFNYPSYVGGSYHTFTLHRKATTYDLYVDGTLIHTIAKNSVDDGLPQYVLFNVGRTNSGAHNNFTSAGNLLVDYVRAWTPTVAPATRPTNPMLINWAETFDPGVVTEDPHLWAHPGAIVITGATNYNDAWVHDIAAGGATVLLYLDALLHGQSQGGRYYSKLHQASEFGAAVPHWPPGFITGVDGRSGETIYLADFRTAADGGGLLQSKLPGVMQLAVDENPHIAGFFLDDLGTWNYYSGVNFPSWSSTEKAKYRRGAIAIAQTARNLADANDLFLVGNGTWVPDPQGGGYPDSTKHGCSLLDGGGIENHPEDAFWDGYANAPQWGQATPRKLPYCIAFRNANDQTYANGWIGHCSHAQNGLYAGGTPHPWGTFTDLGLPRRG